MDTRNKHFNWRTRTDDNIFMPEQHYRMASLAVLMDIRDELQTLNAVFQCHNALAIPDLLRAIKKNTTKKKRKKAVPK